MRSLSNNGWAFLRGGGQGRNQCGPKVGRGLEHLKVNNFCSITCLFMSILLPYLYLYLHIYSFQSAT